MWKQTHRIASHEKLIGHFQINFSYTDSDPAYNMFCMHSNDREVDTYLSSQFPHNIEIIQAPAMLQEGIH